MGWTKRQLIEEAFNEIGLASYVFDLTPDDIQDACRRMDTMVASWNGVGVRIGYPLPSSPGNSNVDSELNIPDWSYEAIFTNLSLRIANSYGKTVSQDKRVTARESYLVLLKKSVYIGIQPFPSTLPAGAGYKRWRNSRDPFLNDCWNSRLYCNSRC